MARKSRDALQDGDDQENERWADRLRGADGRLKYVADSSMSTNESAKSVSEEGLVMIDTPKPPRHEPRARESEADMIIAVSPSQTLKRKLCPDASQQSASTSKRVRVSPASDDSLDDTKHGAHTYAVGGFWGEKCLHRQ